MLYKHSWFPEDKSFLIWLNPGLFSCIIMLIICLFILTPSFPRIGVKFGANTVFLLPKGWILMTKSVQNVRGIQALWRYFTLDQSCGSVGPPRCRPSNLLWSSVCSDPDYLKDTLPDFVRTPQIPQFSCRVLKDTNSGIWGFGALSPNQSVYINIWMDAPLLLPSWSISLFQTNSQKRSYLAGFRKVITSRASECNIIQNLESLHGVWRGKQISLRALTEALKHRSTHTAIIISKSDLRSGSSWDRTLIPSISTL